MVTRRSGCEVTCGGLLSAVVGVRRLLNPCSALETLAGALMATAGKDAPMPSEHTVEPEVIFAVVFEDGLLFFGISNRAAVPATKVVTKSRRPVLAPDGVTDLSNLNVFNKAEFLAPGKVIRVLVDSLVPYFVRRQPNFVHIALTRKQGRKTLSAEISDDLQIYRDLPYIFGLRETARRRVSAIERIN